MYIRHHIILLLTLVLSAGVLCARAGIQNVVSEADRVEHDTTYQRLEAHITDIYYQTEQDYKAMDHAAWQLRQYCSQQGYDDSYYRAYADQILYYKNGMNFYYAEQLIEEMLEELRRRPNDTGQQLLYYLMGSYYSARGMSDKAEKYFNESVGYASEHHVETDLWLVYYELANLYLSEQRYQEGMKAADQSIAVVERAGKYQLANYSVKCQLAYWLDDLQAMNQTYRRLREVMALHHAADDDFTYYAGAMHAFMNGRTDEALALADSVSAIDGIQLKSELLSKGGRWREALACEIENNWLVDSLNQFGFGELAASLSADMDHMLLESRAEQERHLWLNRLGIAITAVVVLLAVILYIYVNQRRRRADELQQLNDRLYAAKLDAEQDVEAKSRFIQHIGKDIRQPLDEIGQVTRRVAATDSLADDDKQREAERMRRSIARITEIVNSAIKAVSVVALLLVVGCGRPMAEADAADAVTGEDASQLPREARELQPREYAMLDSLRHLVWTLRDDGQYRQAFGVARQYRSVSDSIIRHKHEQALEAMNQVKQNAELTQRTAQMATWSNMLPALVLTVLFTIIAVFLALYAYKRRQDIGRLKAKNDELSQAAKHVAEAAERKAEFLRQMSHEMRTPLNAISGFSQLLLTPGMEIDEKEKREFDQRIMQNRLLMERMVDNMVDVSLLENGAVKPDMRRTPLAMLCRKAVARAVELRPAGNDGDGQTVPVEAVINVPDSYTYVTDAARLCDVLIELLYNAMKVTRQGRITLRCDERQLSVTDTGPGIPQGREYIIFERFEKVDSFVQGAGIGLYRCRLQAALLGVGLRVDTAYTQGARFVIDLP